MLPTVSISLFRREEVNPQMSQMDADSRGRQMHVIMDIWYFFICVNLRNLWMSSLTLPQNTAFRDWPRVRHSR